MPQSNEAAAPAWAVKLAEAMIAAMYERPVSAFDRSNVDRAARALAASGVGELVALSIHGPDGDPDHRAKVIRTLAKIGALGVTP